MNTTNHMSKDAAAANLKRFFADTPVSSDVVSLEGIFAATKRNSHTLNQNRLWLANKLTSMRDYNLIERQYTVEGGKKKLTGLKLTHDGKKALGRDMPMLAEKVVAPLAAHASQPEEVTLETVYRAVRVLREKMPSFDIIFDIKPKI